jgi:hypothetical protein
MEAVKRFWVAPRAVWGEAEHKASRRSMVRIVRSSDYDAAIAVLRECCRVLKDGSFGDAQSVYEKAAALVAAVDGGVES